MKISYFLVFVLFLTLKLTGVIAWSWLWVTAPLWVAAIFAGLGLICICLLVIVALTKESNVKKA